jgi:hypothetical protein
MIPRRLSDLATAFLSVISLSFILLSGDPTAWAQLAGDPIGPGFGSIWGSHRVSERDHQKHGN